MDKITKKLMKYFISIITIVVLLCFAGSSVFLSKIYIKQQQKQLETKAQEIYSALKQNTSYETIDTIALLVRDNNVLPLTSGKMGMMGFFRQVDFSKLTSSGTLKNPMGESFLYYKLESELGDIIVLQNTTASKYYLKVIYIMLSVVFVLAILLSIPLIAYFGKKFTKPIIKLQKASTELANGNFKVDMGVHSDDEIEALSLSLKSMASSLDKKHALQKSFIANISHDFKTPLSVIRSYSEAIQDGLVDSEAIGQYSKDIISEVDKLNSLVMDLLQLSKFQEGGYRLNLDTFNLREFLQSCLNRFYAPASEKDLELVLTCPEVEATGDTNYLSRVLYNFIDNAIKFSHPSSRVEINAIEVDAGIKVSVKDYGIGLDPDILKDIWSRYYKNSESGGIGLGLAICSEILKLHHFEYGVDTGDHTFTEFYFIISDAQIEK